jgi:predicted RNA-binding protein with RPS1 domain
MNAQFDDFNWSSYENGYKGEIKLMPNNKIIGNDNKNKCFSREPYAQQLFNTYVSNSSNFVKKDLDKGDCVQVINMYSIKGDKVMLELAGNLSLDIDLSREKKFIQMFGYSTVNGFIESMKNEQYLKDFISVGIYAYVIEAEPTLKISLLQGHIKKIKEEFMEQINSPSKAYVAKILDANKGGFFVEVQGVNAFMPGSLAAANKIIDFKSYVGKEVIVMIEDFLTDINSFIVSHKKYIEYVLPKKIAKLSLTSKYKGSITGTSKYGIFVEFEEIFTGLLHNSKMKEETFNKFNGNIYKPGDVIEFYINEITKDNRIILTEESPEEKKTKFTNFIKENEGKMLQSKVSAIMNFGIIVSVGDIHGLIPNMQFKNKKTSIKNYVVGDCINVKLLDFKDDKIMFELFIENETTT